MGHHGIITGYFSLRFIVLSSVIMFLHTRYVVFAFIRTWHTIWYLVFWNRPRVAFIGLHVCTSLTSRVHATGYVSVAV